jgi:hypothetical protein
LNENLARLLVLKDHVTELGAPEVWFNPGHFIVKLAARLNISSRLVHMKLLQEVGNGVATCGKDLGSVKLQGEIREVILGVSQLAKVIAGLEEALENRETGLAVSLTPFLALGIPQFQGCKAGASHAKVRGIQDITSFTIHIQTTVTEAKDLQDGELATKVHGNQLGPALLVRGRKAAKDRTPCLTGLVPCCDGFFRDRTDRRVLLVKVEHARGSFLKEFTAAVTFADNVSLEGSHLV